MSIWTNRARHLWLSIGIVAGLILALLGGWVFGRSIGVFGVLGDYFIRGLKMVIVPLIMSTMILGIVRLGDIRTVGRTGIKTLLYYTLTTGLAVVVGLVLVNLIQPGVGASLEVSEGFQDLPAPAMGLNLLPDNIIESMANLDILPLIVSSIILGAVLSTVGERGRPLIDFLDAVEITTIKVVELVILFTPFGVFGLVAGQLGDRGLQQFVETDLFRLKDYAITVLLGLGFHGCLVLPLILFVLTRRNPARYGYNMLPALGTAFSSASSSATLPVTLDCCEKGNGVSRRSASFVLPLGATINMDGTALYEAVAAMFIAQAYGIEMSFAQQTLIFLTATLAAIGAAGIPQAGLITMLLVLEAVDLPAEGIGMILAIDWLLDRFRTTINVWGDAVGAAVIAETREIKLAEAA
ncbi:MAG: dicarboxylate/amino acid:cation symporter [Spirochaetales bacterium]|nr:dicarboxylate/amino acid:cation symporter [Leptospiraceae bacterium]MCP5480138.1 dicarboxylate/amino acid:cation symporter [Spirochaetales bacterium]MCP5485522.1 dicarboxylate/amino acid:cation symporter [Spirochaetales bacterium]